MVDKIDYPQAKEKLDRLLEMIEAFLEKENLDHHEVMLPVFAKRSAGDTKYLRLTVEIKLDKI